MHRQKLGTELACIVLLIIIGNSDQQGMEEPDMQLRKSNGEAGTGGRDHAADLSGTLYETVLLAILEGLRFTSSLLACPRCLHDLSLPANIYGCNSTDVCSML